MTLINHPNVGSPLRRWVRYMLVVMMMSVCLSASHPLWAEDENLSSDQLTLYTLQNTIIPQNDPIRLAYQFYGIEAPPPITQTRLWQRGDRDSFWVSNTSNATTRLVSAELQVVGAYAYFWVEHRATVSTRDLVQLAEAFDTTIYQQVRDLWGEEPMPGVDGDPRIHILLANGLGSGTAAYFARRHNYPQEIIAQSNAREMFFINLSTIGNINSDFLRSTLAHEFQHMIRAGIKPNEETWLNEGFSTFTEGYLGYDSAMRYPASFLNRPETQLNDFGTSPDRLAEYAAGFLFVTYLHDRFGLEAVQALALNPLMGMFAVDDVLQAYGTTADEFFADWVLANLIRTPSWDLGYRRQNQLPSVATRQVRPIEATFSRTLSQYATHYYEMTALQGITHLELSLTMPKTAPLVNTSAHSGDKLWYSNRADVSHMRLYRAFDLRDVQQATLSYQIWYDIEEDWDYGYLLISADAGATWQPIQTERMRQSNPFGNLYGEVGYTGTTHTWHKEVVILDDYAGQEILISFEFISDDAVNHAGMVIDDVAIQEINYFADFETDNGGWISEGWVWIHNEVPQNAWIQVMQRLPEGVQIDRWTVQDTPTQSVTLAPDVQAVFIAISPLARVTTVPVTYDLTIRPQRN